MRSLTIRKRLTLWYSLTILLLLCVYFVSQYFTLAPALSYRANRLLQDSAARIAAKVELDDGSLGLDDDDMLLDPGIWYTVYDDDGATALSNHPAGWLDELEMKVGKPYDMVYGGQNWMVFDTAVEDKGRHIAALRVAMQVDSFDEAANQLLVIFLVLLPVCGIGAILIGMAIARHALRPVETITRTARKIRRGDLSRRLHFPDTKDEVGQLAQTFDEMLDALQAAFEREKQFTSDASHELRTPLSVIMGQAEAALHSSDAAPEEYRQALDTIYHKSRDMQAMLSQLLLLSRGYEQADAMESAPLDLTFVLQDIVEEMTAVAAEKDIDLRLDLIEEVNIAGDLMLITRMTMNLLDNAVKYGQRGGWIRVSLHAAAGAATLTVEDNGIGIPPEKRPHIFKRFYRADPARSGSGVGLGLSLVEWIVKLHQGTIEVESTVGVGTTFTMHFPLLEE